MPEMKKILICDSRRKTNVHESGMVSQDMLQNLILHRSQLLLGHMHHSTLEMESQSRLNPTKNVQDYKLHIMMFVILTDNTIGSRFI